MVKKWANHPMMKRTITIHEEPHYAFGGKIRATENKEPNFKAKLLQRAGDRSGGNGKNLKHNEEAPLKSKLVAFAHAIRSRNG